jgi:hypothetical protein
VLGAVGYTVGDSRRLTYSLHNLRRDIFGDVGLGLEKKWKASAILNERTYRRERKKWEYVEGVVDLGSSLPVVSLFVVMYRPTQAAVVAPDSLPPHVRLLLQRMEAFMADKMPERKAIVVFDSQNPKADALISEAVTNYLFRTVSGRAWRHLLETPLFVESSILPGIQIADLFVSCVRQFHEKIGPDGNPSTPYERAIARLHNRVQETIHDSPREDGGKTYGEYRMPARLWEHLEASKDGEDEGIVELEGPAADAPAGQAK